MKKERETLEEDATDKFLAKLAAEGKTDNEKYPEAEYAAPYRKTATQIALINGLISGNAFWYNDQGLVARVKKEIKRLDLVLGLYGTMGADVVGGLVTAIMRRIYTMLGIGDPSTLQQADPKTLGVYPRADAGPNLRSTVEMNHALFDLPATKQIELQNLTKKDFIYHSTGLFGHGPDQHLKFRIPGNGPWTSIPPFLPDPRGADAPIPGRFISAERPFQNRHELNIRIVDKKESKPSLNLSDEQAGNTAREMKLEEQTRKIIDLIEKGE